jgi:hypothetical protein
MVASTTTIITTLSEFIIPQVTEHDLLRKSYQELTVWAQRVEYELEQSMQHEEWFKDGLLVRTIVQVLHLYCKVAHQLQRVSQLVEEETRLVCMDFFLSLSLSIYLHMDR